MYADSEMQRYSRHSKKLTCRVHEFGERVGSAIADDEVEMGLLFAAAEQDAGWIERIARSWARTWAREELEYTGIALDTFTRGYVRGFLRVVRRAQRMTLQVA